jgi:hypothetical protein
MVQAHNPREKRSYHGTPTYWNVIFTGNLFTLLGATPGDSKSFEGFVEDKQFSNKTPRSYIVIYNRQKFLKENNMPPNEAIQEVNKEGKEQNIGYGRCAETMFYVWAGSYE